MSNFINKTFDHVYCLNLKSRPDRWVSIQNEFSIHNISASRFGAVDGNKVDRSYFSAVHSELYPGEIGCILSHMAMLRHARENNYNNILIFEDDAVFHPEFNSKFEEFYMQLPTDWNMCYIGGNFLKFLEDGTAIPFTLGAETKVSDSIHKCKNLYTTTGYFLRKDFINIILNEIEENNFFVPIDVLYSQLQLKYDMYVFCPRLIYQAPGISDIVGGHRDYSMMRDF